MSQRTHMELLSPCGSFESLRAAIQAGCDAVYFGVEQLNMRVRSSTNFSLKDVGIIAGLAREHDIKAYIALNTVLYDHDMSLMHTIIDKAVTCGIDGVIAADHAVMSYAKKAGMPVHISTQANITNIDSVRFYAQFADVMVLARELTLEQIKSICGEIKRKKIRGPSGGLVRAEVFAHGALCMAVSGKCYLSLHSHFASANRGACVQNCRRNYIVIDKEDFTELEIDNEYIMSAKDLCTVGFLDKIIGAGVSVLKIEGRGRSEEYVHTVTKVYREAIDSVQAGTMSGGKISEWKKELGTVFNRGFWEGYYLGKEIGEWNNEYGSKATQKKLYVGKGIKYFDKISVGEFKVEAQQLKVGDEILISGPTTGLIRDTISELRINNRITRVAGKGDVVSLPVKNRIRPSDKLYKVIDV